MARVTKADAVRNRLRFLYEMGDAAVPFEAWRDTDANVLDEYGWTLDEMILVEPWPPHCLPDESGNDKTISLKGPGGLLISYTKDDICEHCKMPFFHDQTGRCICCDKRRQIQ